MPGGQFSPAAISRSILGRLIECDSNVHGDSWKTWPPSPCLNSAKTCVIPSHHILLTARILVTGTQRFVRALVELIIRARLMIHRITEERCRGIRELCNWQGMLSTAYSNSRKDVRGERNGDKAALRFLRKTRVAVGHGNSDDFERAAGVIGTGANYRRVTEIKASHRTDPRVYTH